MKIAVVSDIHGNALAFDAVLADLAREAPDAVACLGDAIQGGPEPARVVAQLRALACPVVMGNADAFLLADDPMVHAGSDGVSEMSAVRAWTVSQLDAADLAFVRAFVPHFDLPLEAGRTLRCYHGSPDSFDQQILPETPPEEARSLLGLMPSTFGAGGHTHVQFILHMDRTFHFNPGSIGFAYRHHQDHESFRADPWAEYALLTDAAGRISLDFRRVPFDPQRLIEIYRSSGRPFSETSIQRYSGWEGLEEPKMGGMLAPPRTG